MEMEHILMVTARLQIIAGQQNIPEHSASLIVKKKI